MSRLTIAQNEPIFDRKSEVFKGFFQPGQVRNYGAVPSSAEFNVQDNFTIELVVRFNDPLSVQNGVIFCNSVGPNGQDDWGFGFMSTLNNKFGFHVCNVSPAQIMANQTDTVSACKWYHLTGVKQGQTIRFYLNGELKATNTFAGPIRTSTGPAQFGYHRPPFTHWNNGNMDEFRLWNYAKTEAQIKTMMNDTLLGNEPGLRIYYKFDETGQGGNVVFKNSASATGSSLNGSTVSINSSYPKFASTETLPFPPPPLVPTQPQLCPPGGQFNLSVNSPTGLNISRFYWYNSNHPDTSRIPNTIRMDYTTPFLSQTDTFFVSSVNSQFCESRKVAVVAKLATPPPASVITFSGPDTACEFIDGTLAATDVLNATYTWWNGPSPTAPYLMPGYTQSSFLFSGSASQKYWSSYIKPGNPCPSPASSISLVVWPRSVAPNVIQSDTAVCAGSKVTLLVAGAGTRKVRLYSDSLLTQFVSQANLNQGLQTPALFSNSEFWVALSADVHGCESYAQKVLIKVNPLPDVEAGSTDTICSGQTIQVGATGNLNYSYQWSSHLIVVQFGSSVQYSSDTVPNPLITIGNDNFFPAQIMLTVGAENRLTGCRNSDSAAVTVGVIPLKLGINDTTLCGTNVLKLARNIPSGAAAAFDQVNQYQWTTDLGTLQNPTTRTSLLTLVNSGQTQLVAHSVLKTVDTRFGCQSVDTVTIRSNPLPIVEAGNADTTCSNQTFQLGQAGSAGYHYQWSPAASAALTYSSDTVANPTVQYYWSVLSLGTSKFKIVATDRITGCQSADSVLVTVGHIPVLLGINDTVICGSSVVKMDRSVNPINADLYDFIYSYNWTTNFGTLTNPTSRVTTLSLQNVGQTQLVSQSILHTTDTRTGCNSFDTVIIRSNPIPIVEAGNADTLCSKTTKQLGDTGFPHLHYQWSFTGNLFPPDQISFSSDTISNPILYSYREGDVGSLRFFKVVATDRQTGCSNLDSAKILLGNTHPRMGRSDTTLCGQALVKMYKPATTLIQDVIYDSAYVFQWVTSLGTFTNSGIRRAYLQVSNSTPNPLVSTSVVTVTSKQSLCVSHDTVHILVNPLPLVSAGTDTALCSGSSALLGFAGNLNQTHYQWTPAQGLSSDTMPNPTITFPYNSASFSSLYVLTATDRITGCEKKDTLFYSNLIATKPLAGVDRVICYNGITSIGGLSLPHYLYSWSPMDGLASPQSSQTAITYFNSDTLNKTLSYILQAQHDSTGCQAWDTVQVLVKGYVRADAGSDVSLCSGDVAPIGLPPLPNHSYLWTTSTGLASVVVANTTVSLQNLAVNNHADTLEYKRKTTFDDCSNFDSLLVVVYPRPGNLQITGSKYVCPGTTDVLYGILDNEFGHTLNWSISGGNIPGSASGDSVLTNWGETNPNAVLAFLPTNIHGCPGDSVRYLVKVNQLLLPEIEIVSNRNLIHNDSVCVNQARSVKYHTKFTTPGSSYQWSIVPATAGEIVSDPKKREIAINWSVPGTYQLSVSQFDTTNIDTCFGSSELYTVHILPSPDTTLGITGDSIVCAFSTNNLYHLGGSSSSSYSWQITRPGENQAIVPEPGSFSVSFGNEGVDSIKVLETNTIGCPGKWINKVVGVKPLPNTQIAPTDELSICLTGNHILGYRAVGLPGSTFQWSSDAGSILAGQGSDSVTINWNVTNTNFSPSLNVLETTAFGCKKDTLPFSFVFDDSSIELISVSTLKEDDRKIEVRFGFINTENHPSKTFELWKDNSFHSVFNSGQVSFVDSDVFTHQQIHRYQLKTSNLCKVGIETPVYPSIYLEAKAQADESGALLQWNPYVSVPNLNGTSVIYGLGRKVDGLEQNGITSVGSYNSGEQPDTIRFEAAGTENGFTQCYRIVCFDRWGKSHSYSNWACADFEHLPQIPNLITPNSDGKNDVFEVKNLGLYPNSELQIFDRWGKTITSSNNYQNDWTGEAGTYFYKLRIGNQEYKGWLEVVK